MNYAAIYEYDTLNTVDGFSLSLFISGCGKSPKCRMCHNQKAWDFNYGKVFTLETVNHILDCLKRPYIKSFCLLGGEPSDNLQDGILFILLDEIKSIYPHLKIICWTGYLYDDIYKNESKRKLLNYLDILVDGEFIPELKDLNRPMANSTNQRVIDVKKSLEQDIVVIYEN